MIKRLIVGIVLGLFVGGLLAAGLGQGLGLVTFAGGSGVWPYLAAAVTGVVTGFIAGKPIWSQDGKIEAGLKAFFGALLAMGGMFALRQWGHIDLDLTGIHAGQGELGQLPAVSLPLIAGLLGAFFELDNTGEPAAKESAPKPRAAAGSGKNVRVSSVNAEEFEAEDEEEPAAARKKR